jgi:hypothetical protein
MAAVGRHAGRRTAAVAFGLVALGLMLAAVVWMGLRPPADALDERAPPARATPGYFPGGSGCRPEAMARVRVDWRRRARADRCAQAAEARRLQVETLRAAVKGGRAERAQARLAYLQTKILVVTAIFVGWILLAVLWAACWLSQAAPSTPVAAEPMARPVLKLQGVIVSPRPGAEAANGWFVKLDWRNVGRAPAIIEDCVVRCADADRLSSEPDYAQGVTIACPPWLASGEAFQTLGVGPPADRSVRNGEPVRVAVVGRLVYRDQDGVRHETGFSLAVSPDGATTRRLTNSAYDYST